MADVLILRFLKSVIRLSGLCSGCNALDDSAGMNSM